jgi:chromosome segregation ATPase
MNGTLYLVVEILVFMVAATALGFMIGRASKRSGGPSPLAAMTVRAEKAALRDLEEENDRLLASLAEARLQVAALERSDTSSGREALTARVAASDQEISRMQARAEEAAAHIEALETERDRLQADLAAQSAQTEEGHRAELDELRVQLEARTADHTAAVAEVASLKAALERSRDLDAIDHESGGVEAQEAEIAQLRAEMQRHRAEIARLQGAETKIPALQAEVEARGGRIAELEAALRSGATTSDDAASIGISLGGGNFADTSIEFDSPD